VNISVVICTRDRHETIGQAVESVAECEYASFDIHVMDQSTSSLTRDIVQRLAARFEAKCPIQHHHLEKIGLSRAYNAGVRASDGSTIACADDDVIVPADWLSKIARAFDEDPQAGLVFGQVLIPASLAAACHDGSVVPSFTFAQRRRVARGGSFTAFGMGANMAFRRSLFEQVGGFDEALGGGGPLRSAQDFDFAYRAYRLATTILMVPDVQVDHYGVRTSEQWPHTLANYGTGDGSFYAKHIRCGDALALWLFLKVLLRAHARWIRRVVKARRWLDDPYASHLLQGVREAAKFAIDRKYRLFRETQNAEMTVTAANAVTPSRRGDGQTRG
jgi:GT2 family glycosyltransferase